MRGQRWWLLNVHTRIFKVVLYEKLGLILQLAWYWFKTSYFPKNYVCINVLSQKNPQKSLLSLVRKLKTKKQKRLPKFLNNAPENAVVWPLSGNSCIFAVSSTHFMPVTVHHVRKCMSCHKAIAVITGRAHCFHDCRYILYQFESHLYMCWINKKNSFKNTFIEEIFCFLYRSFVSIIKI